MDQGEDAACRSMTKSQTRQAQTEHSQSHPQSGAIEPAAIQNAGQGTHAKHGSLEVSIDHNVQGTDRGLTGKPGNMSAASAAV